MKVEVADNRHTDIEQTVLEAYRDRAGPFVGTLCTLPMSPTSWNSLSRIISKGW
jgi:hypothetical protein